MPETDDLPLPGDVLDAAGRLAGVAVSTPLLHPFELDARLGGRVRPVEPAAFDDTRRSLSAGHRVDNATVSGSICDSLLARTPAALPFDINRSRVSGVLTVSDKKVFTAMRMAFEEFRIVLEPGGAVALAAALANPDRLRDRTTVIIASGGNVDAAVFARAVFSSEGFDAA